MSDPNAPLPVGQQLGRFTIVRKLVEAGMAEIYLATRTGASAEDSKPCVLKRVRAEFRKDEKFVSLFESEAALWSRLDHKNIVQLMDFDRAGDELFLVMQYVDGCSLDQLRHRQPDSVMPPFIAAVIAREVAAALAYGHALKGADGQPLNLLHRDVSPHNVLISNDGSVLLTDFVLSKPLSRNPTGRNLKGKIAYLSPEQAQGQPVDGRTDVFSLGVVLFELLTGTPPFHAESDVAFIRNLMKGSSPAPAARSLNAAVPEELDAISAQLLQRDPASRPTSAQAEEALSKALAYVPDAEKDLQRFVAHRMAMAEPAEAPPRLDTGAFDDDVPGPRRRR